MKNKLYNNFIIISLLILSSYLASCDKIEEPYKYPDFGYDSTGVETGKTITDTIGGKVILLEDYTGHTCVNCPKAHVKAHELLQTYGNKLIVMAVHQGTFAKPENSGDFTYDFRVLPSVDDWALTFGIKSYPAGMINRIKFNNGYSVGYTSWNSSITDIINEPPQVSIKITNIFNSTHNRYSSKIVTDFKNDLSGNYKLLVCILEDGIVKPQKNNDATIGGSVILDYVHNHVLRGVNSTWGIPIGTDNISAGTKIIKWVGLRTKADWIIKNLSVVALVYDAGDYHILQAAMAPLDIR